MTKRVAGSKSWTIFDLVFKQMNDISLIQQQLKQSVDDTKAEQKLISKQVQANGQAVASLTLRQMENEAALHQSENVSLGSGEEAHFDNIFANKAYAVKTEPSNRQQHHHKDSTPHHALPKMQFPTFDGNHPKIWLDNCDNYFTIYKTEEEMKVTYAGKPTNRVALGPPGLHSVQSFCPSLG